MRFINAASAIAFVVSFAGLVFSIVLEKGQTAIIISILLSFYNGVIFVLSGLVLAERNVADFEKDAQKMYK